MSSGKNKKQPVNSNIPIANTKNSTTSDQKVANDTSLVLKEETLRWILSVVGALVVYWVVASIIVSVYHPDINPLIKLANEISFVGGARPEPVESLLFRTGVLTIAFCIYIFYIILSKTNLIKWLATTPFFISFSTLCVAACIWMVYIDFAADNPFAAGGPEQVQNARDMINNKSNFAFFFDGLFLGNNILLYTFLLVPLIGCIFYFGLKKYNWELNPLFNRLASVISYFILGGTVLTIIAINCFEFPYSYENKYDFNSVFYSTTQVYAGVPLLVNGFTNTYGLYPQFLNPVFQLIGLSILKFSVIMSLLLGIAFVLNFVFLKKYVENKIIWLIGCCSVLFYPYLDSRLLTNYDSFFAFYPIRYIIPSTLVFLASLYLNKRSLALYWTITILMSVFVLWNPEFGMVCYLSWIGFNTYNDFYSPEGKIAIKKIAMHWICCIGCIAIVFLLYKLLIHAFYGVWPDLGALFSFISHIGALGFNLLPMVLVNPWNIVALIIILGIAYSIIKWRNKEITPKASIVFLITMISLGSFVYYQGRSHNWTLSACCGFSFMLLTILGDELWQKIKDKGYNLLPLHLLFTVFIFVMSASLFEIVFNAKKLTDLISQDDFKEKGLDEQNQINSNYDFILSHSHEKENIYVFSAMQYQNLYFGNSKRRSAFNPGQMDMSLNSDLAKWEQKIIDSPFNAFIEPTLSSFQFYARPYTAYAACYDVTAANKTMYMLSKRKTKIPGKTFFIGTDDIVIHEKYTDDTGSIRSRINDAFGIKTVTLNPVFAVEVLFYSSAQMFPYATLVGNMDDSSGFIITNIINTPNYFFGINSKGVGTPLPNNEWVYCVMNVYPDHFEVYQNGNLSGMYPIASPMRQSSKKITIGNSGFFRNYVGAISEVAVINKPLDKNQIQQTWDEIKQAITK